MKDKGGDAFPMATPNDTYPGMTLRDYFAGQAAAAFIGTAVMGSEEALGRAMKQAGAKTIWELAAKEGYGYADAILAERSKS